MRVMQRCVDARMLSVGLTFILFYTLKVPFQNVHDCINTSTVTDLLIATLHKKYIEN
jgi:hypothetical protein